jgi:hypothetical protein
VLQASGDDRHSPPAAAQLSLLELAEQVQSLLQQEPESRWLSSTSCMVRGAHAWQMAVRHSGNQAGRAKQSINTPASAQAGKPTRQPKGKTGNKDTCSQAG